MIRNPAKHIPGCATGKLRLDASANVRLRIA